MIVSIQCIGSNENSQLLPMFQVLRGLYTRIAVLWAMVTNWFIIECVSSKVNLLRMWSGRRHSCYKFGVSLPTPILIFPIPLTTLENTRNHTNLWGKV